VRGLELELGLEIGLGSGSGLGLDELLHTKSRTTIPVLCLRYPGM
jgi:hypothetical protein